MVLKKCRTPRERRSREKQQVIIDTAFTLFAEHGFENTRSSLIAETAGVPTYTLYNYFTGKHDIFIYGVNKYYDSIADPIYDILMNIKQPLDTEKLAEELITLCLDKMVLSDDQRERIFIRTYQNDDVAEIAIMFEDQLVRKVAKCLKNGGLLFDNLRERVKICYKLIFNFCTEYKYNRYSYVDYDLMRMMVAKTVAHVLTETESSDTIAL